MIDLQQGLLDALGLVLTLDGDLLGIVLLSLWVSVIAVVFATLVGLPLGTVLAQSHFRGRGFVIVLLNALMSFPPVVVGLIVYLMLSRSGPFGVLGLLFSPTAMIIAQFLLALPIIASITRQTVTDLWGRYRELLVSLGASRLQLTCTLLWEARYALSTAILAGFGRVIGEVGAVMIVGGNIEFATRVLTTAIALETRRGNMGLAIGLGIVLILIAIAINGVIYLFARRSEAAP